MKGEITYQKAYDELSKIVLEIEQERIQLDQLSAKIQRASELIVLCRKKLRETEAGFKTAAATLSE
jgi:exodeoxyribonuclease VII small subunit